MRFISEEQSSALITHEMAFEAAREALIAAASGDSTIFPAVLGHGSAKGNRFSIKAGSTADLAGLKVGSFWPGNPARGLPRHNSLVLLIDQDKGRIDTIVEAGRVNAFRTAAADAVAASVLARPDAKVLTIFGAGNQAEYECLALTRILPIEQVHVVGRDAAKAGAFVEKLKAHKLKATATSAKAGCEAADVIVTATPSQVALFDADWVRPGTHVAGMGSDAKGKQELPVALFEQAALFCDLPAQAVQMGEYQHIADRVAQGHLQVHAIGDVLTGTIPGRTSPDQITVFDSSGVSLQDLIIARMLAGIA